MAINNIICVIMEQMSYKHIIYMFEVNFFLKLLLFKLIFFESLILFYLVNPNISLILNCPNYLVANQNQTIALLKQKQSMATSFCFFFFTINSNPDVNFTFALYDTRSMKSLTNVSYFYIKLNFFSKNFSI